MTKEQVKVLVKKAQGIFEQKKGKCPAYVLDLDTPAKSWFGLCEREYVPGWGRIRISSLYWKQNGEEAVWNTICHEFCHLYCRVAGHGPVWKKLASEMSKVCNTGIVTVGGVDKDGNYLSKNVVPDRYLATLTCDLCGNVYYLCRRGRIYLDKGEGCTCGRCGGTLTFKEANA